MEEGNQTCSICKRQPATHLCKCESPACSICPQCLSGHLSKAAQVPHVMVAVNSDVEMAQIESFMRLNEKVEEFRGNLEVFRVCGEDITVAIDSVIEYLQRYKEMILGVIENERETVHTALETAIRMAQEHVFRGIPVTNPLSQAFLSLPSEELAVFRYSITTPDIVGLCTNWITYENRLNSLYHQFEYVLNPPNVSDRAVLDRENRVNIQEIRPGPSVERYRLAVVESRCIKLMNVGDLRWEKRPLQGKMGVYDASRYVWVSGGLFCSGGYGVDGKCRRDAYILREKFAWEVVKIADMLCARFAHGLWWDSSRKCVLALGGTAHTGTSTLYAADLQSASRCKTHTDLKHCEKYKMQDGAWWSWWSAPTWQCMPEMKDGRSGFNPCEWHGYLYLAGAGTDAVEAWDLNREVFEQVQVRLPEEYSRCVLYVQETELVVISEKFITRWTHSNGPNIVKAREIPHPTWSVLCSMPPVVDPERDIVYMMTAGKCYAIWGDGTGKKEVVLAD